MFLVDAHPEPWKKRGVAVFRTVSVEAALAGILRESWNWRTRRSTGSAAACQRD